MHKYQPRVHVIRKDFSSELSPNKAVPSGEGVKTFSFPETVFTTVTAYQNQQVSYFISSEGNRINQCPRIWDPVVSTMCANVNNPCQIILHNLLFFIIRCRMSDYFTNHYRFWCECDLNHELLQATSYAKAN